MSGYGSSTVRRRRRSGDELALLDDAIVQAVQEEYPVSLRGVFYRVESAGAIEKTINGYRAVGRRLLALRRDGTVPYSHITDGTRWIRKPKSWSDLDQMLDDAAASYRRALWHDQGAEVMVFTEKDAISGVIYPVTAQWDVPLGVLRGYSSESFAHTVAQEIFASGKAVYVYQLGDHDPSGLDAWRDFHEKVTGFLGASSPYYDDDDLEGRLTARADGSLAAVYFDRLAVTEEQIEVFGLPTRPTKQKDSRSRGFEGGSVEVDAIRPRILRELLETAITQHITDREALRLARVAEQSEREILLAMKGRSTSGGAA